MDIFQAKKITTKFPEVIAFIENNDLVAELEVWMKNSIWGIGSRQTIYNALAVKDWERATHGERTILYEAFQMMKEMSAAPAAA